MITTTTTTTTPFADALRAALSVAAAADAAWSECEHEPDERCEHRIATDAADAAVDAAREALRDSREPREWTLSHDGHTYGTTVARSAAGALRVARRDVDPADYDGCSWPLIVEVSVRCEATGECDSDTAVVDQPEPECSNDEGHDWQSPVEIVGGIAENPGVWGNGGGIIAREVCVRCGCGRITDTWAQDPATGRLIGHDVVTYDPDLYADEIAGVEESAEAAAHAITTDHPGVTCDPDPWSYEPDCAEALRLEHPWTTDARGRLLPSVRERFTAAFAAVISEHNASVDEEAAQ